MRFYIVLVLAFTLFFACNREKNPLSPQENNGHAGLQQVSFNIHSIQSTNDGGLIALGERQGSSIPALQKYSPDLEPTWTKEFSDLDGYWLPGTLTSTDNRFAFTYTSQDSNIHCVVTDFDGSIQWQHVYENNQPHSSVIKATNNGGYAIIATTEQVHCDTSMDINYCRTFKSAYLLQIDGNGNKVAEKIVWDRSRFNRIPGDQFGQDVIINGSSTIPIVGMFESYHKHYILNVPDQGILIGEISDNMELYYAVVQSLYDYDMNQLWSNSDLTGKVLVEDAVMTPDGQIVVLGSFIDATDDDISSHIAKTFKFWLGKYNTSGELLSEWIYDGDELTMGDRVFVDPAFSEFTILGRTGSIYDNGYFKPENTVLLRVPVSKLKRRPKAPLKFYGDILKVFTRSLI